jgi:NAD(P)-dependent dehydrogenase (short-subunit alcohol dehydrogenase family)/spore coat polysaccharide biosynthesis predicted glycosyltransferase SpsG
MTGTKIFAYLFCDGGQGKGYGNLYRTAALAASLYSHMVDVTLIYDAPLFPITALPRPPMPLVHIERNMLLSTLKEVTSPAKNGKKLICIDSRQVIPKELTAIRASVPSSTLAHLNDAGLDPKANYDVVVDSDGVKEQASTNSLVLSGPTYSIIRSSITELRSARPSFPANISKVLLTMGAEDPGNITEKLTFSLSKLGDMSSSVTVVCGEGYGQTRLRRLQGMTSEKLKVLLSPTRFPDLLSEADLVVSLGGQTTLEAACLGRPNACVEWDWLSVYVRELAAKGITFNLGSITSAVTALKSMIGRPLSPQLSEIVSSGWKTVDGAGADRLAARLIDIMQENLVISEEKGVAIVIGAAGGIGKPIVELLCARELDVVGVDIVPSSINNIINYRHVICDFASPDAINATLSVAPGSVKYIINVAGGATSQEVDGQSGDAIDSDIVQETLTSNLVTSLSTIRMARRIARPNTGQEISLVLCSSINAIGNYQYPVYSASKGAVESLVHSQCVPLGVLGIRINCIRLGTVVTPVSLKLHGDENASHYDALRELTCLGRFVTLQQAALAFVAVAIDMAGMTGAVIPVDAGQSIPGLRRC